MNNQELCMHNKVCIQYVPNSMLCSAWGFCYYQCQKDGQMRRALEDQVHVKYLFEGFYIWKIQEIDEVFLRNRYHVKCLSDSCQTFTLSWHVVMKYILVSTLLRYNFFVVWYSRRVFQPSVKHIKIPITRKKKFTKDDNCLDFVHQKIQIGSSKL